MKRTILNLSSLCLAAAGALYLAASPVGAQEEVETCTSGSGATCTGENCCANAEFCYSTCPIS